MASKQSAAIMANINGINNHQRKLMAINSSESVTNGNNGDGQQYQ